MAALHSFDAFAAKMKAERLPPVAIDTFRHYWELLRRGETGVLPRASIEPVAALPNAEELGAWADRGAAALERTIVVKLNGGLGTSMGMTKAKSLLPVKGGDSFLDLIAKQVLHLRREHGCDLPLLLMNSFRTQDDSRAALAKYPALDVGLPLDFLQHKVPKIRADDLGPAEWPACREHEWCPPGHGDIYTALLTTGLLDELLKRGFETAFVSNADNLGAVLDLSILGWFTAEGVPFLMEVADRTEADKKGGHLAQRRGGGLVLREVAQCPDDEIDDFQNVAVHRFFNTNTLWIDLRALARVLDARHGVLGLPMIRNTKTLDPADDGSPPVYQLETAMGAAISVFDGARALRVPRERFLPVKTTNDLLGLWSDLFETTDAHLVRPAGGREVGDLFVDLDPRWYKRIDQLEERFQSGAPSLVECRRLTVRGDVRFGGNVVCRGDVTIEAADDAPRVVPDGEVFA